MSKNILPQTPEIEHMIAGYVAQSDAVGADPQNPDRIKAFIDTLDDDARRAIAAEHLKNAFAYAFTKGVEAGAVTDHGDGTYSITPGRSDDARAVTLAAIDAYLGGAR